ncbi:MAG: hypothetical protein RIR26_865 [Pseudomonadota bacterium]|jgi:predicted aminopeptidase
MKQSLFFKLSALFSSALLSGCYTLSQGYEQVRLFSKRTPLDEVLREGTEAPARLEKLKLVPEVLAFAEKRLSLTPGSSYRHYISLDRPALSYVVQAAEKRKLRLKTWWFPIVGRQPYLGYFNRQEAVEFQKTLVAEGYDTVMGGVQAFSLLGYFPDPLYSSMLDGNSKTEFIELLFHETLHRTIYVPDHYAFNENLAEFVSRHATVLFLKERAQGELEAERFLADEEKTRAARSEFGKFLNDAKTRLEQFYSDSENDALALDSFLEKRRAKFAELHSEFQTRAGNKIAGTRYAEFFHPERFNNAALLAASIYESRQEPFALLLEKSGSDLAKFIHTIRECLKSGKGTEAELWDAVANCKVE